MKVAGWRHSPTLHQARRSSALQADVAREADEGLQAALPMGQGQLEGVAAAIWSNRPCRPGRA